MATVFFSEWSDASWTRLWIREDQRSWYILDEACFERLAGYIA